MQYNPLNPLKKREEKNRKKKAVVTENEMTSQTRAYRMVVNRSC